MYILHEQLKGLPGGVRPKAEARITTSIMNMVNALRKAEKDSDQISLTLICEVANIKAVIDLAQNLHQPQDSVNKQDPDA